MSAAPLAAIIVSHGQPGAPEAPEAELAAFAARVGGHLPGWQVTSATLASPGALEAALDACPANPLVYPMFMSEGWFTRTRLPQALGPRPARITPPFGIDPGLPAMAAELLGAVLAGRGWHAAQTQLFIAGHGSGRSPNAARDTRAFAAALGARLPFAELRTGFVEEPPFLGDAARGLGARSVCLPFFAARLGHVLNDLPDALGDAAFEGVLLAPIGCAPQVPKLVARSLLNRTAMDCAG